MYKVLLNGIPMISAAQGSVYTDSGAIAYNANGVVQTLFVSTSRPHTLGSPIQATMVAGKFTAPGIGAGELFVFPSATGVTVDGRIISKNTINAVPPVS